MSAHTTDFGAAGARGADHTEQRVVRTLSGWQRLLLIVAALWAIPVFAYTLSALLVGSESEIQRRWVVSKLYLVEEFYGSGPGDEYLEGKRQRLYGSASDEEIIRTTEAPLGQREHANLVPIDRIQVIEREYDGELWIIRHIPSVIGIAFLYWLTPLTALFLLGNAAAAMGVYGKALAGGLRGRGNVEPPGASLAAGEGRASAHRIARLLARASLIVVAGFYLEEALGWAYAWYLVSSGLWLASGNMDPWFEAAWQSLSAFDQGVRAVQVAIISMASVLLILGKRAALPLVLATIVFSIFATAVMPQWTISFLANQGVVLLMLVAGYIYWLDRWGLLR